MWESLYNRQIETAATVSTKHKFHNPRQRLALNQRRTLIWVILP